MVDLTVKIGDIILQNPVQPASGAFSWEYNDVIDLNRLGALVAKTICREPVEIDDVVVFPGKRAGGRLHRILQGDVADLDGEIYHPTASCILKTGPSRQTRLSTRLPSTSNVRTQT